MSGALFEMRDFAPPKPAHAEGCTYCRENDDGEYPSLERHNANHLPITCEICGRTEVNSLIFEMNHYTRPRRPSMLKCTALWLCLNHLTYDLMHGELPEDRDAWVLDLGWRLAPNGDQIQPAGWAERLRGGDA